MASMTLNLGDATQTARVINALCIRFSYQDQVYDEPTNAWVPNPETKAAFAKRMVIEWMKSTVREQERQRALTDAAAALTPPTEPDIT